MVSGTGFDSRGTWCSAWYLEAGTDALSGPRGRPCVVMGHGFGATKDAGLLPFAERFAAAGADVLVFDHARSASPICTRTGPPHLAHDHMLHHMSTIGRTT